MTLTNFKNSILVPEELASLEISKFNSVQDIGRSPTKRKEIDMFLGTIIEENE